MKHFKTFTTSFSDPDLIDEADQVYADGWPEIEEECGESPNGQHAFSCAPGADPTICIHCEDRC